MPAGAKAVNLTVNSKHRSFPSRILSFGVIAAALVYLAAMAYTTRSYFVDDAYIGFRYVDNFVSGKGFVFNPPDRVEGISNIGWLAFLAPWSFLADPPVVAKIAGIALVGVTVVLTYLIALRLMGDRPDYVFALPIPLLVATHYIYVYFSLTGMETALLCMLLSLIVYFALLDRYKILSALLASFAFLVHPECILIYPLALLIDLRLNIRGWKKHIGPMIVFVGAIIGFTIGRYLYYGSILPNTFYAKPSQIVTVIGRFVGLFNSTNPNIPAPFNGILVVVLLFFGIRSFWKKFRTASAYIGAIVLVGMFFCIYSQPDWSGTGRYFAPYVPIASIPFWAGLIVIHRKLLSNLMSKAGQAKLLLLYASIMVACNLLVALGALGQASVNAYPAFVLTSEPLVKPALWIRDNLPDESIIATKRIGALSYYSQKNVFDCKFGLTNKEVAKLVNKHKRYFSDLYDPALKDIWKKVSPDYILEDLVIVDAAVRASKGKRQRFQIHGIPYRLIKRFPISKTNEWALCEKR